MIFKVSFNSRLIPMYQLEVRAKLILILSVSFSQILYTWIQDCIPLYYLILSSVY